MIFFENETDFQCDFSMSETASLVVEHILKGENCPCPYEISILITDEENIRKMNKEFRGIDSVTDVLSFPNVDFKAPADYHFLEKEDEKADVMDPENGCLVLGDMVICAERMLSQAEEYGHGIKREFAFLVAHSTLHLIGYDHMDENATEIMEGKQKKYLDELGIVR